MPIRTVLLDLDDTLLENNMDRFLASYFELLSNYVQHLIEPESFIAELLFATQAMITNEDGALTNQDVFWTVFCERTGLVRTDFQATTDNFYSDEFGKLKSLTRARPAARDIVELCLEKDLPVVIATNPLFPMAAIKQRLSWADVSAAEYQYQLITAYENMHSTKPNEAYYTEILEHLGTDPEDALMVGDDWKNDIEPASKIGLQTYWITELEKLEPEREGFLAGFGSLSRLYTLLNNGWLLT